jgi:hypothetical protein
MLTQEFANQFAQDWIAAWNAHDLERILSHYRDDFEMTSPFILAVTPNTTGALKGKGQVREYWSKALARLPDLKFETVQVTFSVNSIALYYKNVTRDRRVIEWFLFDDVGKCIQSIAHYNQI